MEQVEQKVKERPILFQTPMVQAILEGRKTVTRRVIKDKYITEMLSLIEDDGIMDEGKEKIKLIYSEWADDDSDEVHKPEWLACDDGGDCVYPIGQGYGREGDVLWVRETWYQAFTSDERQNGYVFKADFPDAKPSWKWKPSIFMPYSACRLKLKIESITVERLQDITEEDAIREGVEELLQSRMQLTENGRAFRNYLTPRQMFNDPMTARESFRTLFESINGTESWSRNDWVWRIQFSKL
jgi:hypothetical protein